jgi:hypothetical protein
MSAHHHSFPGPAKGCAACDITAAIRAFTKAEGLELPSGEEYGIPAFSTDEQVQTFQSLTLTIDEEMQGREGVAWNGRLSDGNKTFNVFVHQDGNGGCNFYDAIPRTEVVRLEGFAKAIFGDAPESLDTLCMAVEMYREGKKMVRS